MRFANFFIKGGTQETGEALVIVNTQEAKIIVAAVEEFAARNKRSKKIKAVCAALVENLPVS